MRSDVTERTGLAGTRPRAASWPGSAQSGLAARRPGLGVGLVAAAMIAAVGGCSRESLRVALNAQQRADQVQQAVFDRQHEALCILLYRDLARRLEEGGLSLTAEQQAALNEAWNDRDLVEFWLVQHEQAAALRLVGVDAKLYSDQSMVDLLYKSLSAKAHRGQEGLAAQIGQRVADGLTPQDRSEP